MAREPSPVSTASQADESALVEQARAGDVSAFGRLVTRYQDRVLNTCWRVCGDVDDAQDLTQEAFLRAFESFESFRSGSRFYTWLFRIAVNLSISHRRRSGRRVTLSLHGPDGEWLGDHQAAGLTRAGDDRADDPVSRLAARERGQAVVDELNELDDEYRTVLVLRDVEGFDYQQIAEVLEIPVGTVKSRLHRGRMELRDRLKGRIDGER
jgi:RNA polymerase sigma-70 factor (ECF subfamily)